VLRYLPGYLIVGSNGGGEAYVVGVLDERDTVYEVPFIGMDRKYLIRVASLMIELAGLQVAT
jgi:hypothetical protein